MTNFKIKFLGFYLFFALLVPPFIPLPSKAASVLASWLISNDGVLKFRTSPRARLDAFFQPGFGAIGDRIWIDFPGELTRPRKIKGNGPIKEIRLGKPYLGKTRLVIEFEPYVSLKPSQLELFGTTPNLWQLNLVGLNTAGLKSIGEGELIKHSKSSFVNNNLPPLPSNYQSNISALPRLQKGKFKVVLDPGHGGPDSGAVGINGLKETDVVLDISKKTARLLSEQGIIVKLTRDKNIDLNLTDRVLIANRANADAFISIHANASRGYRRDISGIETYFFTGYKGKKLASDIQKELISLPGGSPDRGVRQNRFFVIRKTNMPAALVEVGFVTGRLDANLLSQETHRRAISFAISKGILNYLKETY